MRLRSHRPVIRAHERYQAFWLKIGVLGLAADGIHGVTLLIHDVGCCPVTRGVRGALNSRTQQTLNISPIIKVEVYIPLIMFQDTRPERPDAPSSLFSPMKSCLALSPSGFWGFCNSGRYPPELSRIAPRYAELRALGALLSRVPPDLSTNI